MNLREEYENETGKSKYYEMSESHKNSIKKNFEKIIDEIVKEAIVSCGL